MSWKPWNHQFLSRLQIESPEVGPKWKSLTQSTLTIPFSGWHKNCIHIELNEEQSYHNFFLNLLPHEGVTTTKNNPPPHLIWAMERKDRDSINRIVRMRYKND